MTVLPHSLAVVVPVIAPPLSVRFHVPTSPPMESVQVPVIEAHVAGGARLGDAITTEKKSFLQVNRDPFDAVITAAME